MSSDSEHLPRQLNLRDLVLSQVLTVVGSAWVGIAAGLGHAQTVVWLLAFGAFYLPMAAAVYHLNREMPLEGGLYVWTRRAFGDTAGFLVAWNIWAYALSTIATILFQIPSEFAYMVGPRAAWIPENHLVVFCFLAVVLTALALSAVRVPAPRGLLGQAARHSWRPRLDRYLHRDGYDHSVHAGGLGRRRGRLPSDDGQRALPDEGRRSARRLVLPPEAGPGSLETAITR